nr:MAG TPA: hypothetical protein [Caudoviricetes sp.]
MIDIPFHLCYNLTIQQKVEKIKTKNKKSLQKVLTST